MNRFLSGTGAHAAFALLAACAAPLAGCDTTASNEPATLSLAVSPTVNGAAYARASADTLFDLGGGMRGTLAGARIYLSQIELLRADGSAVALTGPSVTLPVKTVGGADSTLTTTDRVVLVKSDLGETSYALGSAPAGAYTGLRFVVGLSGPVNRADATQAPALHPLAKQTDLSNFWSWNSGYIFARLEGQLDANDDGVADADAASAWNLHLGLSSNARRVTLARAFTLGGGQAEALALGVDFGAMLRPMPLATTRSCMSMGACAPVAVAVANALPSAFSFTGLR